MDNILPNLSQLRQDYQKHSLSEKDVDDNPVSFFQKWMQQAIEVQEEEPNAMVLATVGADGYPSARLVLLKGIENNAFVFYTNYESNKGLQLLQHPKAALVFHWRALERQVRIEGDVTKVSVETSKKYFDSRPEDSRIGAIVSPQSREIPNREWLEQRFLEEKEKYKHTEIVLPNHWGGFQLKPKRIEFWQGRSNRLHDRILFELKGDEWTKKRLAP